MTFWTPCITRIIQVNASSYRACKNFSIRQRFEQLYETLTNIEFFLHAW